MWVNDSNPLDKLGKVTFIPVLFQVDAGKQYKEKDIAFWTKNSIHKYPYFLVNAHHHKKSFKDEHVAEIYPESVIFGDSGGLQAVTLGIGKPDIKELTRWQEKRCSIGFGFDELPFKTDVRKLTGWEFDAVNFTKYGERSRENLEIALETRTNPHFKLYGIVQGRNFDEYAIWHDIIKSAGVDGYCVKSPSNNPVNVAESCLFAYHHLNHKPLHLLGMSNLSKTLIIYYFSQYYKNKITFDSSTYNQGLQFRTYVHPTSPSLKIRYVKEGIAPVNEESIIFEKVHDLSFCGCPSCSFVTTEEFKTLHESNDTRLGSFIMVHNFIGLEKMFKFASQICHNKGAMVQLVRSIFKEATARRVCDAFDVIDEGVTKGYKYISAKYKSLLTENIEVVKQTSISDFIK